MNKNTILYIKVKEGVWGNVVLPEGGGLGEPWFSLEGVWGMSVAVLPEGRGVWGN